VVVLSRLHNEHVTSGDVDRLSIDVDSTVAFENEAAIEVGSRTDPERYDRQRRVAN